MNRKRNGLRPIVCWLACIALSVNIIWISKIDAQEVTLACATVDVVDQIRAKLTGDREDQQMNQWLAEGRRRTPVVYHEEAFR